MMAAVVYVYLGFSNSATAPGDLRKLQGRGRGVVGVVDDVVGCGTRCCPPGSSGIALRRLDPRRPSAAKSSALPLIRPFTLTDLLLELIRA